MKLSIRAFEHLSEHNYQLFWYKSRTPLPCLAEDGLQLLSSSPLSAAIGARHAIQSILYLSMCSNSQLLKSAVAIVLCLQLCTQQYKIKNSMRSILGKPTENTGNKLYTIATIRAIGKLYSGSVNQHLALSAKHIKYNGNYLHEAPILHAVVGKKACLGMKWHQAKK